MRTVHRFSQAILILAMAGGLTVPSAAQELLIIDWETTADKSSNGFPQLRDPKRFANGDWTKAPEWPKGTFHMRLEFRKMPKSKQMNFQFCFYQDTTGGGEACAGGKSKAFYGPTSGPPVVLTWNGKLGYIKPMDWTKDRTRVFWAIRLGDTWTRYLSPYASLNGGNKWAGENPDDYFPMEFRVTTVVVAPGDTFSGWGTYIKGGGGTDPGPGAVAKPTITPAGGSFTGPVTVKVTTVTAGAQLRYTLDGKDPTTTSPATTGTLTLDKSATLKVKAFKNGMTPSTVASAAFTIKPPSGALSVWGPMGGEQWTVGSTLEVRWSSLGNIQDVQIELSRDGGSSWETIAASTANDGGHFWTVSGPASGSALIRVSDTANPSIAAVSPNVFAIVAPDTAAPVVSLTALGIDGFVDDLSVSAVTLGGSDVPVKNGTFRGEALISAGRATLTLRAADPNGNLAERNLDVR